MLFCLNPKKLKYTLGFSPCPNDTFIFDAMVNHKIDTEGLDFDIVLEDVQTLNEWALAGRLDFTKISYGVLPLLINQYVVLNSGGALGKGVGPLLIAKENNPDLDTIAIPGENTTAHLLFSMAYPHLTNKVFKVFNEIEEAVLQEKVSAGVIIHENRFTYHLKGLKKIVDLGTFWENQLNIPIPLGGIIARRSLDRELILRTDRLIRKSVAYAFEHHHKELAAFVQQHAQEMSEEVMRQHINLYVNDYSLQLGADGKKAVLTLIEVYNKLQNQEQHSPENIFID